MCLDSATTSRGLSTIIESSSFNTTSCSLLVAVFRGLPSAVDKHKGIGDNGYDNAFSQSVGMLFLAENESKDPMISRFALIVVVLLSFAITFEQIWDLNDFIWFLAIGSWNYYFPFSFVIVSL